MAMRKTILHSKNFQKLLDYDMNEEVKDYYKRYYNYDLSDEQIKGIFNPSSEAAKN